MTKGESTAQRITKGRSGWQDARNERMPCTLQALGTIQGKERHMKWVGWGARTAEGREGLGQRSGKGERKGKAPAAGGSP
jgi:hypothetical protein